MTVQSAKTLLPQRRVGTAGPMASVLSLGSWHIYDRMDFSDSVAMVREAVDHGLNMFDVGVYGFPGHQPPVFTDVLFSAIIRAAGVRRDQYLLSSKLWLEGYPEQGLRAQLENALFRAGTDHADIAVLGDLRKEGIDLRRLVLDLADLEQAGLLGCWGVNNWSAANIQTLIDIAAEEGVRGPQIAQLKYSLSRRSIADGEPFAALFAQGLTMQASDVMEGGILAGKLNPSREVGRDPGSIRDAIIDSYPGIKALSNELGTTPAQLCIAFTLTHPANSTTLFGASSVEQLRSNFAAVDLVSKVGAEELRRLAEPFWADKDVVSPAGP